MSIIDHRFIVIMPTTSTHLSAFYRLCSIVDTLDTKWLTDTYISSDLNSLNSGAYVGNGMPVEDSSGTMAIVQAFKDNVDYSDDIFNAIKAGNTGNAGLTEAEFDGVRADMILITAGTQTFEEYIDANGYTLDAS